MAQIDTSIYNQIGRGVESVADLQAKDQARQQNALALQTGQQNLIGAKQKADEYTRGLTDDAAYREAAKTFGADPAANYQTLMQRGLPNQALAYQKSALGNTETLGKIDETKAKTQKETIAAAADKLKQYRGALDYVDTPQGAARWLQAQFNDPLLKDQMGALGSFDEAVKTIPQDPAGFQTWRQRAALGMEKHLEQTSREAVAAETGRHNKVSEQTAAGQLGVAQGNLAVSRGRLDFDKSQPKGVITQTDQGPVLADPRTGVSKPLTMDGETLGAKEQPVPAAANKSYIDNRQSALNLDRALKLAEKNPDAFGPMNYIPGSEYRDQKGVEARAAVANVGSLLIHDRSGAAVTIAEMPRLAPFVPAATDRPETVAKKLKQLQTAIEESGAMMVEAYPALGKRKGGASASYADHPAEISDLLKKYK